MAKRKPTDIAQMNLRLPESLRKKVEVEAKKNGRSLNGELVERLKQSFVDQGIEALIQSTAQAVAAEVFKLHQAEMNDLIEDFNEINRAHGKPELPPIKKQGEPTNG